MQVAAVVRVPLSALGADLVLRVGATLGAKVLSRNGDHGLLLLGRDGVPLVARLPADVAEGARLRLRVTELGGDTAVLQVVPDAVSGTSSPYSVPQVPLALPVPGMTLRVEPDGGDDDGGGGAAGDGVGLVLRYDSPVAGRLDIRIRASAIAVHAAAGEPAALATQGAALLAAAVERATGSPTQVSVHPRIASVDVRG